MTRWRSWCRGWGAVAVLSVVAAGGCAGEIKGQVDGEKVKTIQSGFWVDSDYENFQMVTVYLFSYTEGCRKQSALLEELKQIRDDYGSVSTDDDILALAEAYEDAERSRLPRNYWHLALTMWADSYEAMPDETFDLSDGTSASMLLYHAWDYTDYVGQMVDGEMDKVNGDFYFADDGEVIIDHFKEDRQARGRGDAHMVTEGNAEDAGDVEFSFMVGYCERYKEAEAAYWGW